MANLPTPYNLQYVKTCRNLGLHISNHMFLKYKCIQKMNAALINLMLQANFDDSHSQTHLYEVSYLALNIVSKTLMVDVNSRLSKEEKEAFRESCGPETFYGKVLKSTTKLDGEEHHLLNILHTVFIASFLHDVLDHKYNTDPEVYKTNLKALEDIYDFLDHNDEGFVYNREVVDYVISNVSYSKEIRKDKHASQDSKEQISELTQLVLDSVRDADRLDALGPRGIARVFLFTGQARRTMEEGIHHIDEKILKLGQYIKTQEGRYIAEALLPSVQNFRDSYATVYEGVDNLL